jgi:6-phosphogluconolactonase (cycloisomerase 2 family)
MNNVIIPIELKSFVIGASGKFLYAMQTVEVPTAYFSVFYIRSFSIDYQSGAITQRAIPDVLVPDSDVLFAHPTLPVLYLLESHCCAVTPSGKLHVYSLDDQSGAVTEMPQSPVELSGGYWQDPSISADGAFLYAHGPLTTDPRLAVFRLDQNGVPQSSSLAVTALPPFPGTQSYSVHPNGRFLYGWGFRPDPANPGQQLTDLHMYRLDEAAGSFSQEDISSALPGLLWTVTFDTSGRHFYMRSDPNGSGSLQLFDVDQTTGDLTYVGPQQ